MREEHNKYNIIVIGGGAAGMMAALSAAIHRPDAAIVILERFDRVGKKLLATGNGRCNFSNSLVHAEIYNAPAFIEQVFQGISPQKIWQIFSDWGLIYKSEEGRLYPFSGSAVSILDILKLELQKRQVQIKYDFQVVTIKVTDKGYLLQNRTGQWLLGEKIIVATGGQASPQLGSDGSGYQLLTALGHSITPTVPGLTSLQCPQKLQKALQLKLLNGLRLQVEVALYQTVPGKPSTKLQLIAQERGEILFREYGLSGIAIFQLSRFPGAGEIQLDLFPDLNYAQLIQSLFLRRKSLASRDLTDFFTGALHPKIAKAILERSGIKRITALVSDLADCELKAIAGILKAWKFPVIGPSDWQQAQITIGGMDLADFNPITLESRMARGVYAAGEILDIDGPCGGYNLHWAWSSGWLAGEKAATSLN